MLTECVSFSWMSDQSLTIHFFNLMFNILSFYRPNISTKYAAYHVRTIMLTEYVFQKISQEIGALDLILILMNSMEFYFFKLQYTRWFALDCQNCQSFSIMNLFITIYYITYIYIFHFYYYTLFYYTYLLFIVVASLTKYRGILCYVTF